LAKDDKKTGKEKKKRGVLESFESLSSLKRFFIVLLIHIVLMVVFLPEVTLENKVFLSPDAKAPMSFASVGKEALKQGEYPLWNPYIFCGMPSFSSLAYTPYVYPVSYITHILHTYLHFPQMTWLLFHYVMAGVGVYLLLLTLGVSSVVATIAGVIFMLMPNYIAMGVHGHGSQASAIAYMPFVLLLVYRIFNGKRPLIFASLLGIVLGFQLLRGHVQISYYTFLLVALVSIFEVVHLWKEGKKQRAIKLSSYVLLSVVAAFGVAAVLVFPVKSYSVYSIRGAGGGGLNYGYATSWSLGVGEILTFIFPWAYGFGKHTYFGAMPFTDYPNYLGLATVIFAIFALLFSKHRWKLFLVLVAVVSTLLAFGKNFPLVYDACFKFLPYFNRFRVPVMVLIVQQLAVVLLFGFGLEEFISRLKKKELPKWMLPSTMKWILVGVAVLILFVALSSSSISDSFARNPRVTARVQAQWIPFLGSNFVKDLFRVIILLGLTLSVVFLAVKKKIVYSVVLVSVFVLLIVDLFYVDRLITHPEIGWKSNEYRIISHRREAEELLKSDPIIDFLKEDKSFFRIFPAPYAPINRWTYSTFPFSDNRFMAFRIFSLGGYHAAKLKVYQDVLDVMFESFRGRRIPQGILNMLNAKYIVSYSPIFKENESYPLVFNRDNFYVYRNVGALPRVFLVDRYRVMDEKVAIREITSNSFDPSKEVLLTSRPNLEPVSKEGSTIRVKNYNLNSIEMEASIASPCIAVVSEIFYPEWKLFVDGVEKNILRANYCLRAFELDSGRHSIQFRFSSSVIKRSFVASITTFSLLILLALFSHLFIYRRA